VGERWKREGSNRGGRDKGAERERERGIEVRWRGSWCESVRLGNE
jgi:hypothetical protein